MKNIINYIKTFSKENFWIYILFVFALVMVLYTWNWNIYQITCLFILNFMWNIFVMAMQDSFSKWNARQWSIFQIFSTITFLSIWLYGAFFLNQFQYIIWQIAYILSAIKSYFYFTKKLDLKYISWITLSILNILFLIIFIKYFSWFNLILIIQALWFSLSSIWFVLTSDKRRYFTILAGTWLIILGSLWIVYNTFMAWNLDWIALWYFILSLTVWIYYLKLLKKYL